MSNPDFPGDLNSATLYHTLLESAPDAILITDEKGRILIANNQAEKLFGYRREELVRQPIELLIPENYRSSHVQHRIDFEQHPRLRPMGIGMELVALRKDGGEFPVEISLSPIQTENGLLVISIIRNIRERKETEKTLRSAYEELEKRVQDRTAELQQAYQELQARNEELDSFSHTVAHDLKSQLALITGYAEVLRENLPALSQENQLRYLESIARNGYKMARIVESLLLMANVRQSQLEKWPLQMEAIIEEVRERLAYELTSNQAELVLPDKWPKAYGNGPLIEEVWANYISNGLKYGGKPPRLELGALAVPGNMIKYWVQDNGSGLSPEQQAELFKPFSRVGKTRSSGSGLGLSIVRRIVEKMGGEVGVESQPGCGSRFFFTLPSAE